MQSFSLTTGTPSTRLATAPQRSSLFVKTKGSVCKAIMAPSAADVVLDQAAGEGLFKPAAAAGNLPASPCGRQTAAAVLTLYFQLQPSAHNHSLCLSSCLFLLSGPLPAIVPPPAPRAPAQLKTTK